MNTENNLKKVLINVEEYEIRIAFLENRQLVDLFIEKKDDLSLVGNIYKGVIEDIVPGLQAAFVDIGLERRAFLHFEDFYPDSLNPSGLDLRSGKKKADPDADGESDEDGDSAPEEPTIAQPARRRRSHGYAEAREVIRNLQKGQPLLVQVSKDEIGQKGPRIRTDVAIPGRHLVLLPYPNQRGGISRKIEDEKERQRLRKILGQIKNAERSFIIRTAGKGMDDESIKSDIGHLRHTWAGILRKYRQKLAPMLLLNDHDLLYRIVRDLFSDDIDEIIVDDRHAFKDLKRILKQMIPSLSDRIHLFNAQTNMFFHYDVEKQIRRACHRKVWLKSGGYVVFDETEALTAIDVNSGRFTGKKDQEIIALKTNIEACQVIPNQLRLRDIGGIVVVDFIDMRSRDNQLAVEHEFRKQMKEDRAKYSILPISEFGLLEITRKRVRQSLGHQIFSSCPYCEGSGRVMAPNQIWREIKYSILNLMQKKPTPTEVTVVMHPRTKNFIQEKMMDSLKEMEKQYKVPVSLLSSEDLHIEDFKVKYSLPERTQAGGRGQRQITLSSGE